MEKTYKRVPFDYYKEQKKYAQMKAEVLYGQLLTEEIWRNY